MKTDICHLPDYAAGARDSARKLEKVGIKGLKIPMLDPLDEERVLTEQSVYVSLDRSNGIHVSRLIKALIACQDSTIDSDDDILTDISSSHDADNAYWECNWENAFMVEDDQQLILGCKLEGVLKDDETKWFLTTRVPYASVCPCSAEMTREHGGYPHMQRCHTHVTVQLGEQEELGTAMSVVVSAVIDAVQLIPMTIMKRPDELEWCQRAAETQLFVEDAARVIADNVAKKNFLDFVVACEHEESIHQYDVVAICRKPGGQLL